VIRTLLRVLAVGLVSMTSLIAGARAAENATVLAQAAPAADFNAATYFSGKTIRIIVGFKAGGGTDIQARHFAAHWAEFLPGKPRFNVTNVTPDITATNVLFASKPDGMTLELTASSYVTEQFTDPQAKFNIAEVRVIGTHNGSSSIMLVRKDFPFATLREAMGTTTVLRVGAQRPDSGYTMRIAAMSQWLNIPVKFVSGLAGTSPNLISLERGDIEGYLAGGGGGVWYSLPFIRPGWLKDGTLRAWANLGPSQVKIAGNAEMPPPDAPYVTDLLTDPEQKRLFDLFAKVDAQYGKIFIVPPRTPAPVVDALRKSYAQMLADQAFRTKLEEIMGEPVVLTDGETVEKDIGEMVRGYGADAKRFEEWIDWAKERF
jgi:hypothetical protein